MSEPETPWVLVLCLRGGDRRFVKVANQVAACKLAEICISHPVRENQADQIVFHRPAEVFVTPRQDIGDGWGEDRHCTLVLGERGTAILNPVKGGVG